MDGYSTADTMSVEIIVKSTVILIPIGFICLGQLHCSLDYSFYGWGSTLESPQAAQRVPGSQFKNQRVIVLPVCVALS